MYGSMACISFWFSNLSDGICRFFICSSEEAWCVCAWRMHGSKGEMGVFRVRPFGVQDVFFFSEKVYYTVATTH